MALHDPRVPNVNRPLDVVDFGPGIDRDIDRRLLSDVSGRRILEVGCGQGHTAVGLARRGARVIAIDADVSQLSASRALAAEHEVTIEFHQAHTHELAFLAADMVDVAVAVTSLSFVADLSRVFRQVHRVIKPSGHFVMSVPHPAALCADPDDPHRAAIAWSPGEMVGDRVIHTAESIVTALSRSNFAVDNVIERAIDGGLTPATLVVRARKLGI